jgi:hypothetical protein
LFLFYYSKNYNNGFLCSIVDAHRGRGRVYDICRTPLSKFLQNLLIKMQKKNSAPGDFDQKD